MQRSIAPARAHVIVNVRLLLCFPLGARPVAGPAAAQVWEAAMLRGTQGVKLQSWLACSPNTAPQHFRSTRPAPCISLPRLCGGQAAAPPYHAMLRYAPLQCAALTRLAFRKD